ncbi:hypothetical protein CEXT_589351 [Caerostris extrusa]|uniref:Uncharacterized protein n=1 Tax=Caerostris extrusa TaxID=172846 RepID=A0AAV4QID3_CAEEX|nr:hypothetical protein CEXT_589351 [Caerostris extrusa]
MKRKRISWYVNCCRSANEPNLLSTFLECQSNSALYRKIKYLQSESPKGQPSPIMVCPRLSWFRTPSPFFLWPDLLLNVNNLIVVGVSRTSRREEKGVS